MSKKDSSKAEHIETINISHQDIWMIINNSKAKTDINFCLV